MGDALKNDLGLGIAGSSIEVISIEMETEMSDLVTLINNLAVAAGTNAKETLDLITGLQNHQGDLASLTTTHKDTLVGAIVELKSNYAALSNASEIDDTVIASGTGWSSFKIDAAITAAVNGIVNNAPAALDTLSEIATALGDNPDVVSVLQNGLENKVDFSKTQTLTAAQKATALGNIGAAAISDLQALQALIGDVANANFVDTFNTAKNA